MGKEGIVIVTKALRAFFFFQIYLITNFFISCYIFQQDKGGFRGSLVASALGAHMKKTIGYDLEASGVGFPIGGLAVAATVVCYFSILFFSPCLTNDHDCYRLIMVLNLSKLRK